MATLAPAFVFLLLFPASPFPIPLQAPLLHLQRSDLRAGAFHERPGPALGREARLPGCPQAALILDPVLLVYCGYIGGNGGDIAHSIAVDTQGRAYVTGATNSDETSFPVTVGPSLIHQPGTDCFVARLNPQGTALDYCGYLGGAAGDMAFAIAVDGLGRAYLTGNTDSEETTFPVAEGMPR